MLDDNDPDEIIEIAEIAQNHGLDMEEAEHVKELMSTQPLLMPKNKLFSNKFPLCR